MSLKLHEVTTVSEGDGVDVKRLLPLPGFMNFDPFVLWDHFNIGPGRGFPEHPHRGFEAITYMFDGGMKHKDNIGNESYVSAGGAQRFTAGRGLVHSEMPAETGESNGIQLWINLPQRLKKIEPDYQQVNADEFPVIALAGGQAKILVGENSPLLLNTKVIYQHLTLKKEADYSLIPARGMRGIIYLMQGAIEVNNNLVKADQALFVEHETTLEFKATQDSQFMICMGMPHGEPIRQYGPYVD